MSLIFTAIFILIIAFAVEYLTRSAPQPLRWAILALMALGLLWWLFSTLGVM